MRKYHKLIHGTFGPRYYLLTLLKLTHAQVPQTQSWHIRPLVLLTYLMKAYTCANATYLDMEHSALGMTNLPGEG